MHMHILGKSILTEKFYHLVIRYYCLRCYCLVINKKNSSVRIDLPKRPRLSERPNICRRKRHNDIFCIIF